MNREQRRKLASEAFGGPPSPEEPAGDYILPKRVSSAESTELASLRTQLEETQARLAKAWRVIDDYAQHFNWCEAQSGGVCRCGLNEALEH